MKHSDPPKILLLGGTSETAPLATRLARAGYRVLVSTATDEPLQVGEHSSISRRCGRLDQAQMAALVEDLQVVALVDATHPYASEVHRTARQVAGRTGRPYLRYQRQGALTRPPDWVVATDHAEAARIACQAGAPVLLTTGSRHLAPYVVEAARRRVPLFARVLDHPESVAACAAAGLDQRGRIVGRGPFSLEQNRALIRQHQIGVVVSKDSGRAGGVEEKWQAARLEECLFVVVQRPEENQAQCFATLEQLVSALQQLAAPSATHGHTHEPEATGEN